MSGFPGRPDGCAGRWSSPVVSRRADPRVGLTQVGQILLALVVALALGSCSTASPLGEYRAARTLRVAPDGRLVVTDLGSGDNDGMVVAVDPTSGRRATLLADLPSTRDSGQAHADLAGPSGADVAADGTVCVVIGEAPTKPDAGFATLRCSSGLVVDLHAFQARRRLPSNPYDVVWDGRAGWYVSDGAANNLLHVDRAGTVTVVASFPSLEAVGIGERDGQGVPTGLARGPDRTLYVALYGGEPFDGSPAAVVAFPPGAGIGPGVARPMVVASLAHPIAVAATSRGLAVVDYGGAPGIRDRGEVRLVAVSDAGTGVGSGRVVASGLDRPTGVAELPDGHLVVAESDRGRLRAVRVDER
jgi:hypothetical protein